MVEQFFHDYIGEYNPITYESCELHTYCDSEGFCNTEQICNDIVAPGLAGVDYYFVFACIIFVFITLIIFKGFFSLWKSV